MCDKETIENCYRQMYRGMIEKNHDILTEVLDDSFVLVHMTGMRQSKSAFILSVENGTLNYFSANHWQINSVIHGNSADLVGKSIVSAQVFGGGRHTWRLELKLKLVKKSNTWRITEVIASTY